MQTHPYLDTIGVYRNGEIFDFCISSNQRTGFAFRQENDYIDAILLSITSELKLTIQENVTNHACRTLQDPNFIISGKEPHGLPLTIRNGTIRIADCLNIELADPAMFRSIYNLVSIPLLKLLDTLNQEMCPDFTIITPHNISWESHGIITKGRLVKYSTHKLGFGYNHSKSLPYPE